MIYVPGEYQILIFNEVGAKIDTITTPTSYQAALGDARDFRAEHPGCSTVVLRVLNNSKDLTNILR